MQSNVDSVSVIDDPVSSCSTNCASVLKCETISSDSVDNSTLDSAESSLDLAVTAQPEGCFVS